MSHTLEIGTGDAGPADLLQSHCDGIEGRHS